MIMAITQEQIDRINYLARKAKAEGLTDAEKQEQASLRQAYVAAVRASLRGQLDNTYVLDPKTGKKTLVKEANHAARAKGQAGIKVKLK